jgi:hypothetical protein
MSGVKPEPQNANQRALVVAIDLKAQIIAEQGREWNADEIADLMTAATPSQRTAADHEFFERYLEWPAVNHL